MRPAAFAAILASTTMLNGCAGTIAGISFSSISSFAGFASTLFTGADLGEHGDRAWPDPHAQRPGGSHRHGNDHCTGLHVRRLRQPRVSGGVVQRSSVGGRVERRHNPWDAHVAAQVGRGCGNGARGGGFAGPSCSSLRANAFWSGRRDRRFLPTGTAKYLWPRLSATCSAHGER